MSDQPLICPSRHATYVPWSFGEVYECVICQHRERLPHTLRPVLMPSGVVDYDSIYPFPEHRRRDLRCSPCIAGFHAVCGGARICDCPCLAEAATG